MPTVKTFNEKFLVAELEKIPNATAFIAAGRRLAYRCGMEKAAQICREQAVVYGSLAEGADAPEFDYYLQREDACNQCAKYIEHGESEVVVKSTNSKEG